MHEALTVIAVSFSCIFLLQGAVAEAQSSQDWDAKATREISEFAENICVPIGSRTTNQITSDVKSRLDGLVTGLGKLDLTTSGRLNREKYVGVLRDRLSGQSLDPVKCKLTILREWKDKFKPRKFYNITLRTTGSYIRNSQFGDIEPSISWIKFYIDDKLITTHHLHQPFRSRQLQLEEGEHTFNMWAEIQGGGDNWPATIKGNCSGVFRITQSTLLVPDVTFAMLENTKTEQGTVEDCALRRYKAAQ